ncbi:hypothetical protein XO70_09320 [Salmonella enterica subsp. enterica]|nr:hypothetical protein [Salmonella enterica subsp. enterica serovar Javiana]
MPKTRSPELLAAVGALLFLTPEGRRLPVFNLSGGEWIVEALKLFEKSKTLRRMFYSVVSIGLIYVMASLITSFRWW